MQVRLSYLVCATPRSGSTLLCETLTNTGLAGYPKEYFEALKETGIPRAPSDYFRKAENAGLRELANTYVLQETATPVLAGFANYAEYLASVLEKGTTPNGVFGAKLMWGYLEDFLLYLREIPAYQDVPVHQLFSLVFPNLHYIHVSRADKVRQAVSLWRAIQTWTWRQDRDPSESSPAILSRKPVFHYAAIDHLVQRLVSHERAWTQFFAENSIHPLLLTYEELAGSHQEIATRILQYLGIPLPEQIVFARPRMERQADELSEQWVKQYYQTRQQAG